MRKFSVRFWLALLIALMALPLVGQTSSNNWKRYENKLGNFAIMMPSEPQDSLNQKMEAMESRTLVAKDQGNAYMVIYTVMTNDQPVDQATYDQFKNGVFNQLPKCTVNSEAAPTPELAGFIGHAYDLSCNIQGVAVKIQGDLYWGKHYAYAVLAIAPEKSVSPQANARFIGSFTVSK